MFYVSSATIAYFEAALVEDFFLFMLCGNVYLISSETHVLC